MHYLFLRYSHFHIIRVLEILCRSSSISLLFLFLISTRSSMNSLLFWMAWLSCVVHSYKSIHYLPFDWCCCVFSCFYLDVPYYPLHLFTFSTGLVQEFITLFLMFPLRHVHVKWCWQFCNECHELSRLFRCRNMYDCGIATDCWVFYWFPRYYIDAF